MKSTEFGMRSKARSGSETWPVAVFPNVRTRTEFLEQVRLWNRVEGLPTIATEPLWDGRSVRFWSDDDRQHGIRRLIDSCGGWVPGNSRPKQRSHRTYL